MQITTVICGFILPRLLLDSFGSEVNGLTQSISQFLGIVSFLELGVGQVIHSSLYRPLANGDMLRTSIILKSGSKYFRSIAYCLIAYIAVLVIVFPYFTDQKYDWMYTALLICAISVDAFARYYFGMIDKILLSADQRGYVQFTAQIITTLLNTLAVVIMIQLGCSIQLVKMSTAVVFLLNPLVIRMYIKRHYKIDRKISYQGEPIAQKWNGIAQHISAVVLEGTDNIVLTLLATLSDVSVYSIYFMVISGIRQLYVAVTAGLQSMIGSLWARSETNKLEQVFSVVEITLHFLVVFLFTCIAVLLVPFVRVYTNGLVDANYIRPVFAAILTLAYGIRCLRTPYNILILAGGHYKQTQCCHIVAAFLNIVISVIAVMRFGLVGVAIGTLIAFTYQTVWMAIYAYKNLIYWRLGRAMKLFLVDVLAVGVNLLATSRFELQTICYWGWFSMALPVSMLVVAITVIIAWVFYGPQLAHFARSKIDLS